MTLTFQNFEQIRTYRIPGRRGGGGWVELKCIVRPAFTSKDGSYHRPEEFGWCLYANVTEAHPLFPLLQTTDTEPMYWSVVSSLEKEMPLHGGCTYYEFQSNTDSPVKGAALKSYITVGCDYSHYRDDDFQALSPETFEKGWGVAYRLTQDAEELVRYLDSYLPEEVKAEGEAATE